MNARPAPAAAPARILIVDDERPNRELLELMLAPQQYELLTAATGERALALVAQHSPDLILLDVMMPGMDGYQVAGALKRDAATKNIPIIMVTALDDRDARMLGLDAGAEDFLTKPIDRAELSVRVRNLLRLKSYADEYDNYSQILEREVQSRTADLVERTTALERQTAVLTEQAALLDLAQDAIIVRDMHDRVLFWNRGAERLYGWLCAEAVGRNTHELLRTECAGPTRDAEAKLLRRGQWEGEAIHYTRGGTRLDVASRWALQRDADGTPLRVLTINNDITHRKQTEADLLVLTERLSLATSVAKVGVWDWHLESNTVTSDATMCAMFGFDNVTETPYQAWASAVLPEDLPAVEAVLQRAIADHILGVAEFRISRTDGAVRNISAIEKAVLDDRGKVARIIGVNLDVTERKQAEAELRTARDAAEAANRAKGEFLANMSHEIRTPMNGVMGMTDLVLDTQLTGEQREYLGIVKSSADALLTLINDILDFSRIEAGKLELDPIDFNPQDAIGDIASTVALRAHQKGLELIVDVAAGVPQMVNGDPGRLRQILLNLIGNAIKFTHHGEIIVGVTSAATTSQKVVLQFSVKDTGVGIPADRQQSVFEAFTQADGSMTRTYGGTGLGLTISSQLVQLMGGHLGVESEVGRGSTFHFTAAFAPATAAPVVATPHDAIDLRNLRVLIVDDNATNRRLLERMVVSWRMIPALARNASDALAALGAAQRAARPFDLVLTDMQMPYPDGFTLAAAIKQDHTIAGVVIVMLTSAGQPGNGARCRELGIAGYLAKPVKRSDLRATILTALGPQSPDSAGPVLVTRHSLREARQAGRILLVEDNSVSQLFARRQLEKRGHTIVVANNGREALAALDDAAPGGFGCVLMDVQMPVMGGLECTAIIRERERSSGGHLPIIAMTADAMTGDEARCRAAGMDGYISKPVQLDDLFDLVDRHLANASVRVSPATSS